MNCYVFEEAMSGHSRRSSGGTPVVPPTKELEVDLRADWDPDSQVLKIISNGSIPVDSTFDLTFDGTVKFL